MHLVGKESSIPPSDVFIYSTYNSKYCRESLYTLKNMPLKDFMSFRENINILELYDAANAVDSLRESNNGT